MLHKTRGIVLKTTKYSESSLVVHILTEKFGLQSYMVNGARKSKAKIRANMLQPLHLVEMVVYFKQGGGLQRITELKNQPVLVDIPFDIVKSSLALFLCDLVYHAVRDQDTDEQMFDFIFNSVELLDLKKDHLSNFHLLFMVAFSRFLGFYPSSQFTSRDHYFDLRNGVFRENIPEHPLFMMDAEVQSLKELMQTGFDNLHELHIPSAVRRNLLQNLIAYYEYHLEKFGSIQSHQVLEVVLS